MPVKNMTFGNYASVVSAWIAAFLALVIFPMSAASAAAPESCSLKAGPEANVAGVIEIGSSGIKPAVFEIAKTAGALPRDQMHLLCVYPPFNTNLASPSNVKAAADKVGEFLGKMKTDYNLESKNVEIVASSGVAKFDNFNGQIRKALAVASGKKPEEIGVVKADEECIYSLNWMALSPDEKSLLVDIGSKNTKACDREIGWELLPFGTKSFEANVKLEIEQSVGEGRDEIKLCRNEEEPLRVFACAAQISRKTNLASALKQDEASPKMIFLIGGAPWAAATRLRPDAVVGRQNVPISKSDIDRLRKDAAAGRLWSYKDVDEYRKLNDEERKSVDAEADRAVGQGEKSVFTVKQYIAGLEIIYAVLDHYRVGFQPVSAAFAADGLNAWSSWYLLTRINAAERGRIAALSSVEAPPPDKFQRLYTDAAIAQAGERFSVACKNYGKALKAIEESGPLSALRRDATSIRLMEIRERATAQGIEIKSCGE